MVNRALKASRSMAMTSAAVRLRTVAVRGWLVTSAISPKHSPGPRRRWRRRVQVEHRVVCGTQRALAQGLTVGGWRINTAFVARLHVSLRQRVAARGRRRAPCKSAKGLGQPLALLQVSHHCVLPHARLRQVLATPVATHGRGSAKVWRLRTPAMAAGRTAHGWSRRAVLMCRVPPGPQPQTVYAPVLMGARGGARLRYVQMEAKWAG